ncbi:MAG TPA: O-acetyl-ADP-ribose deacetylase [Bryobacteraceae bacterium]|nr:O-acetyl-ADP-ribose deacetylase [Bryobacteraceae bacterium]
MKWFWAPEVDRRDTGIPGHSVLSRNCYAMEREFPNGKILKLMAGDITRVAADAIVNAANSGLAGGGGVDGAIHRAGGPSIMRELDVIRARDGGCPTGSAVATGAGLLAAQFVFHAVGPVYRDGRHGEPALLASCYRTCLALAEQYAIKTMAFPSISTGAYGYPIRDAAQIALAEITRHLRLEKSAVSEVLIILFSDADYRVYESTLVAT